MARAICFAVIVVISAFYSGKTSAVPAPRTDDSEPPPCGSGLEEYVVDGTCQPRCEPILEVCGIHGDKGCRCIAGYMRETTGECVLPQNCRPRIVV